MLYYTIIIYFKSYKWCYKIKILEKKFIFHILQTSKNDYMSTILYLKYLYYMCSYIVHIK